MIPLGHIAIQGFKSLRDTAFELGQVNVFVGWPQPYPDLRRRAAARCGVSVSVCGIVPASLSARQAAAAVAGGCWTE